MTVKIWGKGPENKQSIPKIIWTFWDSHLESPLVNICFEQISYLLPEYQLNIVNRKNVVLYLDEIVQPRTDISFVNFTDLTRLKLLNKYGGYWLDASILITENFDWVSNLKSIYNTDLIGFYADFFTSDINFPLLETWFIGSTPGNPFIKSWCLEFEKCYLSTNPKEYFEVEKEKENFLQKMDKTLANYLIAYLAAAKIMRKDDRFRIVMIPSSESAHFYNFGLQLKPHQLAEEFLLNENAVCNLPMIKFERRGREAVDDYIRKGLLSKKSLLYRLAPQSSKKYTEAKYKIRYCAYILNNILKKLMRQS